MTFDASLTITGLQEALRDHLRLIAQLETHGLDQGLVYLDPTAVNPRTGRRTALYGGYEHERGNEHAFYERTVGEGEIILTSWRGIIGPSGRGLGETLKYMTTKAHRYSSSIMHVDTGAMRASNRMALRRGI